MTRTLGKSTRRPHGVAHGAAMLFIAAAIAVPVAGCRRPAAVDVTAEADAPTSGASDFASKRRFTATAYTIEGETAAGTQTRHGIVAADPDILPLGSRIRVHDAGRYSGEYTVEDTGRRVNGHQIDIYIADARAAKEFGRQSVQVEVLERGDGSVDAESVRAGDSP